MEMIRRRRQPYPFKAMLAVCSDLDATPDGATYFEICRFLNTHDDTSLGPGVGLEVGNTIYFRMPPGQFSYYSGTDEDRARLHLLMRSGHVDCLHSFGDLVQERDEVVAAWRTLEQNDCRIEVWIDHSQAKSNFDADIMRGEGAIAGAPCYHADVSTESGIKFVWKGRVTSVIAKNASVSLRGIFDGRHPVASCITLAKEAVKIVLARLGSTKYAMHGRPEICRRTELLSGHRVTEFIRSNPSWGGVSHNETADGIAAVLTPRVLDRLVDSRGSSILYTHLGKTSSSTIMPGASVAAFRRLAEYRDTGRILVTTTRRLLGYEQALAETRWQPRIEGSTLTLAIDTDAPPHDLQGACWYVPDEIEAAAAIVDGSEELELSVNPPDDTGRRSVSVPWQPLTFPHL